MNNKWFEKRGMLLTLIYLHNIGDTNEANQKTISDAINITNDTLKDSVIPELKKQKLISAEAQTNFPFSTKIKLTEKGKKIAVKLEETGIFDYP